MSSEKLKLPQTLGAFSATMIIVGSVIGSGIFISIGPVVQSLPSPLWALGIWLFGGIITFLGALIYSEFAARWPQAGGDYIYLREIYNPLAAFLVGWAAFWIINPASIAALSLAAVHFLQAFIDVGYLNRSFLEISFIHITFGKLISLTIIALFSFIHFIGLKIGSLFQNTITMIQIGAVLLLAVLILSFGKGDISHLSYATGTELSLSSFGVAMIYVIFTFSGWFTAAYVAGEIKNPKKNLPLSLICGVLIVSFIYLLLNFAYIYVLSPSDLLSSKEIGSIALMKIFGSKGSSLLSAVVLIAILGSLSAVILTAPRIYYAMAKDKLFFSIGKSLHPRFKTPWASILIQCFLAFLYVAWGDLEDVLMMTGFPMILISLVTAAGLFKIHSQSPKAQYRTPGYPWTPLLFVLSYFGIAIAAFAGAPGSAIGGLIILSLGVPIYYLFKIY